LNTLSLGQAEVGDRTGALASSTEAVQIRRALVETNQAAFLPNLAMSLNNLSDLLAADADPATAAAVWEDAGAGLPAATRAQLLGSRSGWRQKRGETTAAVADLAAAVQLVDIDAPSGEPSAIAQARRHLRARLATLDLSNLDRSAFPSWTTTLIPDTIIEDANAWVRADWPHRKQMLADPGMLTDRQAVRSLAALHCDQPALQQWLDVLDEIDSRGQEVVFADIAAADTTATLLGDWISTPSWNASQVFLAAHPELRAPEAVAMLEQGSGDEVARQHLAILRLTDHVAAGEVFDAILDATDTRSLLFQAVRSGDARLVVEAWFATPHLAADASAGPLAIALVSALGDDADNGNEEFEQAARAAADAATGDFRRDTLDLLHALTATRNDRAEQLRLIIRVFADADAAD